jgi:hypothetical protein
MSAPGTAQSELMCRLCQPPLCGFQVLKMHVGTVDFLSVALMCFGLGRRPSCTPYLTCTCVSSGPRADRSIDGPSRPSSKPVPAAEMRTEVSEL